jgi:hypothetical protein
MLLFWCLRERERGEEEEAPNCWLCVRERKSSEDMAAICCMDACN